MHLISSLPMYLLVSIGFTVYPALCRCSDGDEFLTLNVQYYGTTPYACPSSAWPVGCPVGLRSDCSRTGSSTESFVFLSCIVGVSSSVFLLLLYFYNKCIWCFSICVPVCLYGRISGTFCFGSDDFSCKRHALEWSELNQHYYTIFFIGCLISIYK